VKKSLIIFLLLFAKTTHAQLFKAGLIGGISAAQIEGDGYGGYKKLGFIVGGFLGTEFSEKMSGQFELYFINKGSFDGARPDKGDYDQFKVNMNYIEVPLLVNYATKLVQFETGIYIAKLLGTPKLEDEFGPIFVNQFPFKAFDFGWLFGASYQISNHFMLSIT
jgi:hypothetical protein